MEILLIAPIVTLGAVALRSALVSLKQISAPANDVPTRQWIDSFSTERYRPVQRLLSEEDVRFAEQNGLNVRQFRAQRRRLCRSYLYAMGRDYCRIWSALQLSLASSDTDRSAEISALVSARLRFQGRLLLTLAELRLQSVGLSSVQVDGLVASLDALRLDLRAASAAA